MRAGCAGSGARPGPAGANACALWSLHPLPLAAAFTKKLPHGDAPVGQDPDDECRDYLAASAMALLASRSASARAASTVASWCQTFWMAPPVASMIPLKPRLIGSLIP